MMCAGHPVPSRVLLAALLAFVCVACARGEPGADAGPEPVSVPTLVEQRVAAEGAFANPEFVGDQPRGPWALRLWVGLWCDHDGHPPGGSDFAFFVDGVPLYRLGGECANPTSAPGSRPNAGAFAFTLEQGAHRLRVVTPDGSTHEHVFDMAGDRWLAVEYTREETSGTSVVAFTVYPEQLVVDRSYHFESAPEPTAVAAYARGERAPPTDYQRPRGALVERGSERLEAGVAEASGAGQQARARRPRNTTAPTTPEGWSDASMGTLAVVSDRAAAVWIDGADSGVRTPADRIPLRMGRYRVELRDVDTGASIRQFSVEIQPGRHRTLVHTSAE